MYGSRLASSTLLLAALAGCATAKQPAVRWVDETTFVAVKPALLDGVRERLAGDPSWHLRAAAALDHNCPLEKVAVLGMQMQRGAPTRYALVVCGEGRVYLQYPGAGYVDVSAASAHARVVAPTPPKAPAPAPPAPAKAPAKAPKRGR
jgi:hypothetical protein